MLEWRDTASPLPLPDGLGELSLLSGGPLRGPREEKPLLFAFVPAVICISWVATVVAS